MIIVGLTDIHGSTAHLAAVSGQLTAADLVIISGDLTHFGGAADAQRIIEEVQIYNPNVLAVPGNCDTPQVGDFLTKRQINLDRKCTSVDDVTFVGIGGSLPCPGHTPNEAAEDRFAAALEKLVCDLNSDRLDVFVTHQPPYGTALDLAGPARHVGSKSVRDFITKTQPMLCLCGHIHEARGADTIGKTKILNPGPLRHGCYVYAEIHPGPTQLRLAEIRSIAT